MRPIVVHTVILLFALVGAYLAWTHEPETGHRETVTVLDVEPDDLSEVRYHAEAIDVRIEPKEDDLGSYVWVEVEHRKTRPAEADAKGGTTADSKGAAAGDGEPQPSEGDKRAGTEPDGAGDGKQAQGAAGAKEKDPASSGEGDAETTERLSFKGNAAAEKIVKAAAPLAAKRRLDTEEEPDLSELGLDEPVATLTVVAGGAEHRYELGDTVYGGDNRYMRDPETGAIYLVDARVLRPFMSARTSLVDRRLFDGSLADWDKVEVEAGGGKAEIVQHNRSDREAAYFTLGADEAPSDAAQAWLKKLLRLRVRRYVGDRPQDLPSTPTLRVTLHGDGKPQSFEVYRVPGSDDAGTSPSGEASAEKEVFFARSDHTRGWVELYAPQARDVIEDVPAVVPDAAAEE